MYSTSQKWKQKIYTNVPSIFNVYIDNVLINPNYILGFKKGGIIFNETLCLGSTPSQYIELKIHKLGLPVTYSKIRIEYGISVNDLPTVEDINDSTVNNINSMSVSDLSKFEIIPLRNIQHR